MQEEAHSLPRLHSRIVQLLPISGEGRLVDVHHAFSVAIATCEFWQLTRADYINVAQLPFPPRRLGPSQRHVVSVGILPGHVGKEQGEHFFLTEIVDLHLGEVRIETGPIIVGGEVHARRLAAAGQR